MQKLGTSAVTWIKRTAMASAFGLGASLAAVPATAQNLFAPAVLVNEDAVTNFEIQQRQRFLQLLNAPGTSSGEVVEALIEDRLKMQAAKSLGLVPTEEGIEQALEEFAGRANLSRAEFTSALKRAGVDAETYRDFVVIGITWREVVRARFNGRVQITDAEIDRALGASGSSGGVRVLISEIIMPAPPQQAAAVQARAERISQITTIAGFSAEARRYSATASRGAGGRLPWMDINKLPPQLRGIILGLAPGEVSDPIGIPNAVALFQLRDIEETTAPRPDYSAIEYAAYFIPGGDAARAQAETLKGQIDTCDDLYGVAQGQPEEVLERTSKTPADLPSDIAIELAKLDANEVSTALRRGDNVMFLMLCGRTAAINEETTREDVASALRQQRLVGYADSYLEQLKADATIIVK
jgi:peptidyl-prolyl cis-trans isomerase SurA